MIIHVLKFHAKAGKEKSVHKIIRHNLMTLKEQHHEEMSCHSFRDEHDKLQFINIKTFESKEAAERYENSIILRGYFDRLTNVIDGCIDYHKMESFEFYFAR